MTLFKQKNDQRINADINLEVGRSMYVSTHLLGGDRITNADGIYLLVYAQQFRPMRIGQKTVMQSYCAYRGLDAPLRIKQNTGFQMSGSCYAANLDHIIPRSKNGEEHGLNYQLLASWYNSMSFKGNLPTFHARWHAFRKGGSIDGLDFVDLAAQFLRVFDMYHTKPELQYILGNELMVSYPWWAREKKPPYRPILFGYDEKRQCMKTTKEESYLMEWSLLAQNVIRFCKMTQNKTAAAEVQEQFRMQYGMAPEVMAGFARMIET